MYGPRRAWAVPDYGRAGAESETFRAQPVAHQLRLEARNLARREVGQNEQLLIAFY